MDGLLDDVIRLLTSQSARRDHAIFSHPAYENENLKFSTIISPTLLYQYHVHNKIPNLHKKCILLAVLGKIPITFNNVILFLNWFDYSEFFIQVPNFSRHWRIFTYLTLHKFLHAWKLQFYLVRQFKNPLSSSVWFGSTFQLKRFDVGSQSSGFSGDRRGKFV